MATSTQGFLTIEEIKDDLVILKTGSVSMILETSSLNFDLLSPREQDAKIYAFAGLLNSLNFQLQIVIRTQPVDLTGYVSLLDRTKRKIQSQALIRQMDIYTQFIKNLIVRNEVLDKRFFIIIPFSSAGVKRTSPVRQMFGKPNKITNVDSVLEASKAKLNPRRDHIIKQLKRINIDARQLKTDELISLFYSIYNPGQSQFRKLQIRPADLSSPIISMTNEQKDGQ